MGEGKGLGWQAGEGRWNTGLEEYIVKTRLKAKCDGKGEAEEGMGRPEGKGTGG